MISQELLAILRCPLNPSTARLVLEGERLVCERCTLRFRIRDGFPVLVVEEAELPPGCTGLHQLPCQLEEKNPVPPATAVAQSLAQKLVRIKESRPEEKKPPPSVER